MLRVEGEKSACVLGVKPLRDSWWPFAAMRRTGFFLAKDYRESRRSRTKRLSSNNRGPLNFNTRCQSELELELIQTHMIQKPMLRVEVCTRALRASQNVKKRCMPCVFALPKRAHGRVL